MQSYFAFLALDVARERAAEADSWRLAALAHPRPSRATVVRRGIARLALAVARLADKDLGGGTLSTRRAN
jgi:hypothetical protein